MIGKARNHANSFMNAARRNVAAAKDYGRKKAEDMGMDSDFSMRTLGKRGIKRAVKNLVLGSVGIVMMFAVITIMWGQDSGVSNLINLGNLSIGGSTYDFSLFVVLTVFGLIIGASVWGIVTALDLI